MENNLNNLVEVLSELQPSGVLSRHLALRSSLKLMLASEKASRQLDVISNVNEVKLRSFVFELHLSRINCKLNKRIWYFVLT